MSHSTVPVAEMKSHLSDYIAKSVHCRSRIVITRRNKPVAALVNLEDLRLIEQAEERRGMAAVRELWKNFDEVAPQVKNCFKTRKREGSGRNVSLRRIEG